MAERHARVLAELSELGLGLARAAASDAASAETPEDRGRAALVFHRVSRSIRQSLALEAKLAREAQSEARVEAVRAANAERDRVRHREGQIRDGVEALIWREIEGMDAEEEEAFDEDIEAATGAEASSDTFFTDNLADQVGRVLTRLGFRASDDGVVRRIPDDQRGPPPALGRAPAWQGSG
jgi:hypothetical protein